MQNDEQKIWEAHTGPRQGRMHPTDPRHPRVYTNRLREQMDEGMRGVELYDLVDMLLGYLSDSEVKDMADANDIDLGE